MTLATAANDRTTPILALTSEDMDTPNIIIGPAPARGGANEPLHAVERLLRTWQHWGEDRPPPPPPS